MFLLKSDAFSKEIFQDAQVGNNLNAKLGNITIQPYVRVEDYTEDEFSQFFVELSNIFTPKRKQLV